MSFQQTIERVIVAAGVGAIVAVGGVTVNAAPAHAADYGFVTQNNSTGMLTVAEVIQNRADQFNAAPGAVSRYSSSNWRMTFWWGQNNDASIKYNIDAYGGNYQLWVSATPGWSTWPAKLSCSVRDTSGAAVAPSDTVPTCRTEGNSRVILEPPGGVVPVTIAAESSNRLVGWSGASNEYFSDFVDRGTFLVPTQGAYSVTYANMSPLVPSGGISWYILKFEGGLPRSCMVFAHINASCEISGELVSYNYGAS